MKHLVLESITCGETSDVYTLSFRDDQGVLKIRCRVADQGDFELVETDPNIFMPGLAPAREMAAAVIAFHQARSKQADWSPPDDGVSRRQPKR